VSEDWHNRHNWHNRHKWHKWKAGLLAAMFPIHWSEVSEGYVECEAYLAKGGHRSRRKLLWQAIGDWKRRFPSLRGAFRTYTDCTTYTRRKPPSMDPMRKEGLP